MNENIREITDKQIWEDMVQSYPEANFLQSWNWGEFEQGMGKKIYRLAGTGRENVPLAEVVMEKAKRGNYAAIYGGPLLNWENTQDVRSMFKNIEQLAHRHSCSFIRFRPQQIGSSILSGQMEQIGARQSPMHLTADLTLQLDLGLTEEELLSQMRKNHRYNIRKAEREGITTSISTDPQDLDDFYQHQLELAKKHGFVPFSKKYLTTQFEAFAEDEQVFLVHAHQGNQLLATTFIITYNAEAVYHYGISTPANEKLPGSYSALWTSILEAKKRGCSRFNFWGIAPENETEHRFAGVSLFKRGFGGFEVPYLPAHDIPLAKSYWLTNIFEKFRKHARGL